MKQFTLDLYKNIQRPLLSTKNGFNVGVFAKNEKNAHVKLEKSRAFDKIKLKIRKARNRNGLVSKRELFKENT